MIALFAVPLTAVADDDTAAACPFPAGPNVVSISSELMLAWDDADSAMAGPVAFSLGAGDWEIFLASYDNHSAKSDQAQLDERWYLEGWAGSSLIFTSLATDDLPEDRDMEVFFAGAVTTTEPIDAIKAVHAAFPDDGPQSVAPWCAAFFPEGATTSSGTTPADTTPNAITGTTPNTAPAATTGTTSNTATADSTQGGATSSVSTSSVGGPERSDGVTGETSVAAGLEGNTAQSLQQLPLTGIEIETAFAAIVALMFGVVLLRRARDWQSRLKRRAARVWRRPAS